MNIKISTKWSSAALLSIAAVLLPGPRPAHAQLLPRGEASISSNPTASIQTVADTPAATLLLPYFEVDLGNANGTNTIFTIKNTGSLNAGTGQQAALTRVTVWSDLGVPVFGFNVYLTGYDMETVDMRRVLTGTLPQTATAGQDPQDTISPKGSLSQDINYASCNGVLPPAALNAGQIASLQASLTGNPSAANAGQCAGVNHSDNIARGYVTIDQVNGCTTQNPGDAGYFGGQNPTAVNTNNLTGEVFYTNLLQTPALSGNLVHIHASPDPNYTLPGDPLTTTSGNYTFYGRVDGFTAADNRQPLSTNFNARYNPGGTELQPPTPWRYNAGPQQSWMIVWRDPKVPQGYFTCGALPAWYPLGQENIAAFDEQERVQIPRGIVPFPAATQKVQVGGSTLPVAWAAGWLQLDLNTTVTGSVGPTGDAAAAQAWVDVVETQIKFMHRAQQADSATMANHAVAH